MCPGDSEETSSRFFFIYYLLNFLSLCVTNILCVATYSCLNTGFCVCLCAVAVRGEKGGR